MRFAAAESLAYLGSPSCGEELGKQVSEQPFVQAFALTALASLNEAVCRVKLEELLNAPSPETRFGAFRALRARDEHDTLVQGENVGGFWLHQVARGSSPQVHYSTSKRAEIVLFGDTPTLVGAVRPLDRRIRDSRQGRRDHLHDLPDDGAQGQRNQDLLVRSRGGHSHHGRHGRQLCRCRRIPPASRLEPRLELRLKVDALPKAPTVYDLARAGVELAGGKSTGLASMSAEIGVTPTLYEKTDRAEIDG